MEVCSTPPTYWATPTHIDTPPFYNKSQKTVSESGLFQKSFIFVLMTLQLTASDK